MTVEAALEQTSARPTILVIDSMDRLENFRGEDGKQQMGVATQDCTNLWKKIKASGCIFGTDDLPSCVTINQFYDVNDFMDPANFFDKPLPRPAEAAACQRSSQGP